MSSGKMQYTCTTPESIKIQKLTLSSKNFLTPLFSKSLTLTPKETCFDFLKIFCQFQKYIQI